MDETLAKVNKTIELMQNDTLKPSDVKDFLIMVLSVIKEAKNGFDKISKENMVAISDSVDFIIKQNEKLLSTFEKDKQIMTSDFDKKMEEVKSMIDEIKSIEIKDGQDGQDADEEAIFQRIMASLPEPKKQVIDGAEVVSAINALPDSDEYKIDWKHIKNVPDFATRGSKIFGGGAGVKEAPRDGKIYGRQNREWIEVTSGGGTWGSITGTLASQTDLQDALDLKYDASNPSGFISDLSAFTTANLADSTNKRYVTDAQLTVIGNTSGVNTGDNAVNSLYSGLATSKQDALSGTGFVKISGTTISYDNSTYLTTATAASTYQPLDTQLTDLAGLSYSGNALKVIRVNAGETGFELATVSVGGSSWGSITGTLSDQTDLQTALDAKVTTDQTVGQTIGATGARLTKLWATDITVTNAISGSVTGNAATATALQNARTIGGVSFDGTANITVASATGGFTISGGNLALGTNSITMSGSIGVTGTRVTKLWATDGEFSNMPTVGGTSLNSTFQPLDSDLTTIAGLTATTDNFIVSVASAWASRTPAQVKSTLALNNVENTALSTWAGSSNITTVGTLSSPTLTTPVINGTITGTGQATAATASTIAMRDASANIYAVNTVLGFRTQATAAGTTTLVVGDGYTQVFTGSTTQTVKLPTTGVSAGHQFFIINQSTGLVTVQSSGANTIVILAANTSCFFTAVVATPTTAANWNFAYAGVNSASGKVGTINNNLTFSGTDGTTMTFPSTSATIARTDAANTFTGTQTFNGTVALGSQSITMTGSIAATGARVTKGWFTDIESTNMPTVGGTAILTSLTAPQFTTIELGNASDTTLSRSSAGVLAVEGVTVSMNATTATHTAQQIELGHASDTTLTRVSAGVVAIEGNNILTAASTVSALTTVGTITSGGLGTGAVIAGVTMTLGSDASGDMYYRNSSGVLTRIAAGAQGTVLQMGASSVPAWATPSGLAFAPQDLELYATTNLTTSPASFAMTSNSTGSVIFICIENSGGGANIYRFAKDATGCFYQTHATTYSQPGGISTTRVGMAVVGSTLYYVARVNNVNKCNSFSATDLSGSTNITFSGTSRFGSTFSDGTDLYIHNGSADQFDRFTISGSTITNAGSVTYTSAGTPTAAISDGTSVWITNGSMTGASTNTIRKYAKAGGSASASLAVLGNADARVGGQGVGLFMGTSTTIGLGYSYVTDSATAHVGNFAHVIAVTV